MPRAPTRSVEAVEVAEPTEVVEAAVDSDADREREPVAESEPDDDATDDGDDADDKKTTKLFVNRGERSGIDEEDLRWALREGAVLPDEAVHDVRVLHRFSFVEVDPDQAERTVEFLDGTKLKGKEIRLEVARS